jgi:hypothetical protein
MTEVAHKRLVRWPLILVSCLMVFLIWPSLGFAYAMASFQIEGDAVGEMSPGIRVPIELRFINRHPAPMTISQLEVRMTGLVSPAADVNHPCSLDDFELTQVADTHEWTIPASATYGLRELNLPMKTWPQVAMLNRNANQDGCKGATLTLGYRAHGVLGN